MFALGVAIGLSGCTTDTQTKQGQPLMAKAVVYSTQATIAGVNYDTREVTLEAPNKPGTIFLTWPSVTTSRICRRYVSVTA